MCDDFTKRLEAVYEENFVLYYRLAVRLLRIHTGQTDHALDIVHEAFMLAQMKEEQSSLYLEKWLSKTIKNLSMNYSRTYHVRQKKTDAMLSAQTKETVVAEPFEPAADLNVTLQQRLSKEDYELFVKYSIDHRPIEEISQETDMTPNAIRVRIFRIRKIITQILLSIIVIIVISQYIL